MKTLIAIFTSLLLVVGCDDDDGGPGCVTDAPEMPGIYSRQLGTATIDGEECRIFETYEKRKCGGSYYDLNTGCNYSCSRKILTRTTKCPSNTTVNEVHRERAGKSSREVVQ